jgi:hypothetical protein
MFGLAHTLISALNLPMLLLQIYTFMTDNIRAILGLDEPPTREVTRNRKGVMSYSAKDTGCLQLFTNDSWERNKKYYVPNGPRSCVKNFMRG